MQIPLVRWSFRYRLLRHKYHIWGPVVSMEVLGANWELTQLLENWKQAT